MRRISIVSVLSMCGLSGVFAAQVFSHGQWLPTAGLLGSGCVLGANLAVRKNLDFLLLFAVEDGFQFRNCRSRHLSLRKYVNRAEWQSLYISMTARVNRVDCLPCNRP